MLNKFHSILYTAVVLESRDWLYPQVGLLDLWKPNITAFRKIGSTWPPYGHRRKDID